MLRLLGQVIEPRHSFVIEARLQQTQPGHILFATGELGLASEGVDGLFECL